jgi:anti-sigma regulatory factor (Ser/Thr protein kinase)
VSALDLPPTTDSVPVARRFVKARLDNGDIDVDTATLLVSELVTNAILHARTPVTLTIEEVGTVAHIAVHDGSPVAPRLHSFSATSATGRGLRLLERLAMRWGVESDPRTGGKIVWFEVGAANGDPWADGAAFADQWFVEGVPGEF